MKIIVRKSKYGFSTSFVAKKENEEDEFGYIQVGFRKDNEPKIEEGQMANLFINDGFFSGFKSKDGIKPKLIILDYNFLELKENKKDDVSKVALDPISDENMPF